jgi:hypothetical protein
MYKGSCLCGAVRFELDGGLSDIVYCHCSRCRKAQGSAYATNGFAEQAELRFVSGEDNLTAYESPPGNFKYFCKTCGSPMMGKNDNMYPGRLRLRLGTIDSKVSERPVAHIFATSKADWDEICDGLPEYESYIPKSD